MLLTKKSTNQIQHSHQLIATQLDPISCYGSLDSVLRFVGERSRNTNGWHQQQWSDGVHHRLVTGEILGGCYGSLSIYIESYQTETFWGKHIIFSTFPDDGVFFCWIVWQTQFHTLLVLGKMYSLGLVLVVSKRSNKDFTIKLV